MNPIVSVIIATYRRNEELSTALRSLAQQTYSDFEIVLIDDNGCSAWNKKVDFIVEQFKVSYPQIQFQHIVNQSNQGSAKTRNIGIEVAVGEYITFLDDDDVYLPRKIERQLLFMQKGNYDYSITDLELFDANDKLVDKRIRKYIKNITPQALFSYHIKYHMTGTDTMMFRKDYLQKIGGFAPIDVGDEFYLMQRAIIAKGKFGYLPFCDVKAYVHTGESGLSSGKKKIEGENTLYEYKKKFFQEMDKGTVRYIKARHHAVCAYAYLRMNCLGHFLGHVLQGVLVAPISFIQILMIR